MSFLTKSAAGNNMPSEAEALEEQYLKLFPKIGRDFVTQDDLNSFILSLISILKPEILLTGAYIPTILNFRAGQKAEHYQKLLDKDDFESEAVRDLIILDV